MVNWHMKKCVMRSWTSLESLVIVVVGDGAGLVIIEVFGMLWDVIRFVDDEGDDGKSDDEKTGSAS